MEASSQLEKKPVWRVLKSEKKEHVEVPKAAENFVELALECIKTFKLDPRTLAEDKILTQSKHILLW